MKKVIVSVLMMLFTTALVAYAQGSAPTTQRVATIEDGGSDLLALTSDGSRLVAAGKGDLQARLYDFSDPANPQRIASVDLDGAALAVGAADFALVAVASEGADDLLVVIAPDSYSSEGYGAVNFIGIPDDTHTIAVSPNNRWALVAGSGGYLTMHLEAADNIQTSPVFQTDNGAIVAAALTDDFAYIAYEGDSLLQWVTLDTSEQLTSAMAAVAMDAPVTALAVNADIGIGAAALENNQVALFDLTSLETIGTIALDDGPVSEMHFSTLGSAQYLAMRFANRPAALIYAVTDPATASQPGNINLGGDVQAIVGFRDHLVLSDGQTVSIYQLAAG